MIAYRLAEFGVERMENGTSTFIREDSGHPAWREFQTWKKMGHVPEGAAARPRFGEVAEPRKLWIIGAGSYGREVYWMSGGAGGCDSEWSVAGFLNDIPGSLDEYPELPRIHGDTSYVPQPDDMFICAIGDWEGRKKVCGKFKERGARFVNLIQNKASVSPGASLGEGIIIEAFAGVGAHSRIGDFSTILGHVMIAHDVSIGAYAQISPFACILGRASVGEGTSIGSHAVVLPDVKVGAGATVGAGSVVIKDVPDGATVFGVPAKQIS